MKNKKCWLPVVLIKRSAEDLWGGGGGGLTTATHYWIYWLQLAWLCFKDVLTGAGFFNSLYFLFREKELSLLLLIHTYMYMCSWIIMIQKTEGIVKRDDDNFGVGVGIEEYNTRQVKLKLLLLRLPLRLLGWVQSSIPTVLHLHRPCCWDYFKINNRLFLLKTYKC